LEAPIRAELVLDDDYEDVNDSILAEKPESGKKKISQTTGNSNSSKCRIRGESE
jgi:hypothetical protein